MSNIYISSFIDGPELNSKNLLDSLEDYSLKLEEMAKNYRNIVKHIKTKEIKIIEAHGFSHGGFFCVDEIDTHRLKQAGFVIDFGDEKNKEKRDTAPVGPTFYIDSELEEAMDEFAEEFDEYDFEPDFETTVEEFIDDDDDDEGLTPHAREIRETELFAGIAEPDFKIPENFEMDIDSEPFAEMNKNFSLKEIIGKFEEDKKAFVGQIGVEVQKIDETKFNFNLTIADLNKNPTMVRFDRDTCVFKYQCGSCDTWHYESLASIYKSLKTANALFSNLMVMAGGCKEVLAAFDFVDHDLRLLQSLLEFDYAMEDDDKTMED